MPKYKHTMDYVYYVVSRNSNNTILHCSTMTYQQADCWYNISVEKYPERHIRLIKTTLPFWKTFDLFGEAGDKTAEIMAEYLPNIVKT